MDREHVAARLQLRSAAKAWIAAIAVGVGAVAPQIGESIGDATAQLVVAIIAVVVGGGAVYRIPNTETGD